MVSERRLIDCDVHNEIGDPEEFLALRRARPARLVPRAGPLARAPGLLPGRTRARGSARSSTTGRAASPPPTSSTSRARCSTGTASDVGVLTGDDGVVTRLAHAEPLPRRRVRPRAQRLAARALARAPSPACAARSSCPAQDPRRGRRGDPPRRSDDALRPGPAVRRLRAAVRRARATCRSSRPRAELRPAGRRSTPAARAWASAAPPGGAGDADLLHRVAHARLGVLDHGPPRLAPLPRHFERVARTCRCCCSRAASRGCPGILWRLDTNWRGLRERDAVARPQPSEIVREHVRFTTQPLEHTDGHDDLLFEMLAAAGAPDILCFASDYPHWDFDDPASMLRRLPESWRAPSCTTTPPRFYGARLGSCPREGDWHDVGALDELERDGRRRRPHRRPRDRRRRRPGDGRRARRPQPLPAPRRAALPRHAAHAARGHAGRLRAQRPARARAARGTAGSSTSRPAAASTTTACGSPSTRCGSTTAACSCRPDLFSLGRRGSGPARHARREDRSDGTQQLAGVERLFEEGCRSRRKGPFHASRARCEHS